MGRKASVKGGDKVKYEKAIHDVALTAMPYLRLVLQDAYDNKVALKAEISRLLEARNFNYNPVTEVYIQKMARFRQAVKKKIRDLCIRDKIVVVRSLEDEAPRDDESSSDSEVQPQNPKLSRSKAAHQPPPSKRARIDRHVTRQLRSASGSSEEDIRRPGRENTPQSAVTARSGIFGRTSSGALQAMQILIPLNDTDASEDSSASPSSSQPDQREESAESTVGGNEVFYRIEPKYFRDSRKHFPGDLYWTLIHSNEAQVIATGQWIDSKGIIAVAGLSISQSPGLEYWRRVKDGDFGETLPVGTKELYIARKQGIELAKELDVYTIVRPLILLCSKKHRAKFQPVWKCAERAKYTTSTYIKLEHHMKQCIASGEFYGCVCGTYFGSEERLKNHHGDCGKWNELKKLGEEA